jgi:hypothetical protein
LGILVGKTVSLWRHLKLQCKGAEENVKRIAAEMCSALHKGSRVKRAVPDLIDSVAARAERPPSRRRLSGRIQDYVVGDSLVTYPRIEHFNVVAEFMAFHNVSANAMASEEFRNLKVYYCGGEEAIKRNKLLLTRPNLRAKYLPHRYNIALEQGQRRLGMSTFTALGYSFSCDGWSSPQKRYYEGWCIARPGTAATTVAIRPVRSAELHATSVARDGESVVLEVSKKDGELTALDGYFLGVKSVLDAIVSDSATVNVRACQILSLRHPKILFLPFCAYLAELDCADLLRFAKVSTLASNAILLVNVFNASSTSGCRSCE